MVLVLPLAVVEPVQQLVLALPLAAVKPNTTTGPCTATLQPRIQLPPVFALPLAAVEPGTQQVLALPLAAMEPTTSGPCTATCSRGTRYTYYRSLHC